MSQAHTQMIILGAIYLNLHMYKTKACTLFTGKVTTKSWEGIQAAGNQPGPHIATSFIRLVFLSKKIPSLSSPSSPAQVLNIKYYVQLLHIKILVSFTWHYFLQLRVGGRNHYLKPDYPKKICFHNQLTFSVCSTHSKSKGCCANSFFFGL